MAAYLQDEEGLGSSVGAAFLGLCVCCFLPPPRGLGSVFFPPTRPRRRRHF